MFTDSIIVRDYYETYSRSDAIPGGFTRTVGSLPSWLEHYRNEMQRLGFDPANWDESDWLPELWASNNQLDPRYSPLWFALHAVAGYKFASQTQIAKNRPFINKPLEAEQTKLIHPVLRESLPSLIGFSQSLWANRQACYFMVAEQEKTEGLWEHEPAFYVDSPWGVYLMAKLEKIKQYKIQGSNSLLDELVNYPKRRGPKSKPQDTDAQAKKLETRNRYEQWLQTCAELKAQREQIESEIKTLRESILEQLEDISQIQRVIGAQRIEIKTKQELIATIKAPPFVK